MAVTVGYDDAAHHMHLILLGTAGGQAPTLKFDADTRFTHVLYSNHGYCTHDYDLEEGREG